MRTGWTRHDRITFGIAAFLCCWAPVEGVVGHNWLAAWLLFFQGAIHVTHRMHLRSTHNYAWSAGRTAMILSIGALEGDDA